MSWQKAPLDRDAYSYRADPDVPAFADDHPIVIFDGDCVLCSSFAQFILRRGRRHDLRLLAAQSPLGAALYRHYGLDPVQQETIILIEDGRAWFKSEASFRVFERLGLPWSLVAIGRALPNAIQNRLYDFIATNRFRWFGRRPTCYRPDPADADRFLA